MKISIITPSYNQDKYIEETMLSVFNQAGDFDLEYIVMDGGSTDSTVSILKKYEQLVKKGTYDRNFNSIEFYWISERDSGQSNAINKGLRMAKGDILSYINSDDVLEPGALQLIVNELGNSDKKWSYGKCRIIDKEDKEIRKRITLYKNILGRKFSYSKLLTENFISQMTVFWKKAVVEKCGYFDEKEHLCMDYEYWLRIGEYFEPLYISEYIANFRFYQTSKSGSYFDKQFKDELRLAKKYARGGYKWSLFVHRFNYYKITWIYRVLSFINK